MDTGTTPSTTSGLSKRAAKREQKATEHIAKMRAEVALIKNAVAEIETREKAGESPVV